MPSPAELTGEPTGALPPKVNKPELGLATGWLTALVVEGGWEKLNEEVLEMVVGGLLCWAEKEKEGGACWFNSVAGFAAMLPPFKSLLSDPLPN